MSDFCGLKVIVGTHFRLNREYPCLISHTNCGSLLKIQGDDFYHFYLFVHPRFKIFDVRKFFIFYLYFYVCFFDKIFKNTAQIYE